MEIRSEKTKESIQLLLNKSFDQIDSNDLSTLKNIIIDSNGLSLEESEKDILEILNNCSALEKISIYNTFITKNEAAELSNKNIDSIYLMKCAFEDESVSFDGLKSLELCNSFVDDYDILLGNLSSSIKSLIIRFPADESTIKGELLNRFPELNNVVLEGCIVDFNNISFEKCEVLQILKTKIEEKDLERLTTFPSLKKLYVSENNLTYNFDQLEKKFEVRTDVSDLLYDDNEKEEVSKTI